MRLSCAVLGVIVRMKRIPTQAVRFSLQPLKEVQLRCAHPRTQTAVASGISGPFSPAETAGPVLFHLPSSCRSGAPEAHHPAAVRRGGSTFPTGAQGRRRCCRTGGWGTRRGAVRACGAEALRCSCPRVLREAGGGSHGK